MRAYPNCQGSNPQQARSCQDCGTQLKSETSADPAEPGLSEAEWGPRRMRVLASRGRMQEAARSAEQVAKKLEALRLRPA